MSSYNIANFAYTINIIDFNTLFQNSSYNSLEVNKNFLISLLESESVGPAYVINPDINPVGFDTSGLKTLGYRLLEVSAFSIFNNARARAAIANQTQFINNEANIIANNLYDMFRNQSNSIYNKYITLAQYNSQDTQYNFTGMNFIFNYYSTGYTMGINGGYSFYGSIGGRPSTYNQRIVFLLTESYDAGPSIYQDVIMYNSTVYGLIEGLPTGNIHTGYFIINDYTKGNVVAFDLIGNLSNANATVFSR